MKIYEKIIKEKEEEFKRMVGIGKKSFYVVIKKVEKYIEEEKEKNSLKKRGRKSKLGLNDKILIVLYYIRQYPTLKTLWNIFEIWEGYCCKIYNKYIRIMVKIIKLPNKKELLKEKKELAIDVSEQKIERPVKGQKKYYSWKKKNIL